MAVVTSRTKRADDPAAARLKAIERRALRPLRTAGLAGVLATAMVLPQSFIVGDSLGALVTGQSALLVPCRRRLPMRPLVFSAMVWMGLAGASPFVQHRNLSLANAPIWRTSQSLISPFGAGSILSGEGAALIGDKLDILLVYLTRYHNPPPSGPGIFHWLSSATAWFSPGLPP